MAKSINNKDDKNPVKRKTSKKGSKTTAEIIKRHLSDENDKITEEDLKDVKIITSLPHDTAHDPLPIEEGKERPKDENKDHTMITPWDVINE